MDGSLDLVLGVLGALWAGQRGPPAGVRGRGQSAARAAVLIKLPSLETEIERVQHLHFPLVVFLLILCIWKRQPYANC